MRLFLVLPPLFIALLGLGCASQDPAARATVLAAEESEDAATCRQKSPEDDKAYDACRKELAAARAQHSAVQEQKRRDFDRTLGAGTEGQDGY